MKTWLIYFIIVLFSFFVRIYAISSFPKSMFSDEALNGYEAYSILKTGRDEYGTPFPITFKAFGDYRPGLNIYATVPSVAIFGLNEFAVRLPSVIFSCLTVLVVMLIGLNLFKNKKIAALSGFAMAISPWSIQFARMSHEANLTTFLVTLGILFLVLSLRKKVWLILSALFLALSVYAYYSPRVFVPLFIFFFGLAYWKLFKKYRKIVLIASLIFVVTGTIALVLTATGKLSAENMDQFTKVIQNTGNSVNSVVGGSIWVNLAFIVVVILFIYWISRKV